MQAEVKITDHVIWFKHLHPSHLAKRLEALEPGSEVILEVGNIVGQWERMSNGSDGRKTNAIKPVEPMKAIWNQWFSSRRGQKVILREVNPADDYLGAAVPLFSEWNSPEDEEAFCDM